MSLPFSCPFPAPCAFPPVDTNWKAFAQQGGLANGKHRVGIGGRNLSWMALVCFGETPREPLVLWSRRVSSMGQTAFITWHAENTVGNEKLSTGVVSRGGGLWFAKSRRVFWLFCFQNKYVLLLACCFLLVGWFFGWCSLFCFGLVFPGTYVHVAIVNGKLDVKWIWVMWSSKPMFLGYRPKHTLLKRSHLNSLQLLWFLSEKFNNKCPQQNPGKTPANK